MFAAGLDPGATGAVSLWDLKNDCLNGVFDLPTTTVVIGKHKRQRIDEDELHALFDLFKQMETVLLVIEQVGGFPKQSAAAGFVFGEILGVIRTTARYNGLPVKLVSASIWKPMERVSRSEQAICAKATAEFGEAWKPQWYGPKGGLLHDRAESAFLARYAARRVWPALMPRAKLREALKIMAAPTLVFPTTVEIAHRKRK